MLWLVGSGSIAIEYAKVLNSLSIEFIVIGRGKSSSQLFSKLTGIKVNAGGVSIFLDKNPPIPSKAIVCVNIEELKSVAEQLLDFGVKDILLEKPGGANFNEIKDLYNYSKNLNGNIKIAYNRRYYSSVAKLKELISNDDKIISFNFEFTEWTDSIDKLGKSEKVLKNWFMANSSHVIDLAFFICGLPDKMTCYTSDNITWHKSKAIFCGAGITKQKSFFNYSANWLSAGRWSIEILTLKGKYILCPLEKLFFQKRGSIESYEINFDSSIDQKYKAGFYFQTKEFVNGSNKNLLSLSQQNFMIDIYKKISGFNN